MLIQTFQSWTHVQTNSIKMCYLALRLWLKTWRSCTQPSFSMVHTLRFSVMLGNPALGFARWISFFCFKTKSYFQRHVITAGSKELALKVKQFISQSDFFKSFLYTILGSWRPSPEDPIWWRSPRWCDPVRRTFGTHQRRNNFGDKSFRGQIPHLEWFHRSLVVELADVDLLVCGARGKAFLRFPETELWWKM